MRRLAAWLWPAHDSARYVSRMEEVDALAADRNAAEDEQTARAERIAERARRSRERNHYAEALRRTMEGPVT